MLRSLVVVFAVTVCGLAALSVAEMAVYRLPGDVVPIHYNLSLSTDLDLFVFSGQVNIEIECKSETDTIKIHSTSLEIIDTDVTLTRVSDNSLQDLNGISFDTNNDFLVIKVKEKLVPKSLYILHIAFKGNLTDGLAGYYRSSYEDKTTNSTKWLAVTQFEPIDARRAFPCFDEPAMKAKFSIQLGHKNDLKSISNMPLLTSAEDEDKPGWVWDHYQETVPMSTYLIAFMVSDLQYTQSNPQPDKTLFRVWARKEAIEQTRFALDCGPRFLSFFEDYFGIIYPLPKQDNVAIPDFAAGAMENWGLITYREGQLLVDENTTSVVAKYSIAITVAHELAHQWFGNLVTMKWWTDLWLNEGFATYVASVAMQHELPEWNSYNFEVATNLFEVFSLDALKSSHPVSVPIGHPNEVNQIFDSISYSKGALLLHMMNSFLGSDVFRAGVKNYLEQFSYRNSEQDDLWHSLTEAARKNSILPKGQSVKTIMDTWTLQTGYPVVSVKRNGQKITVSQKRFLADQPKSGEERKECWWIPLTYSTASNINFNETRTSHWLSCNTSEITIDVGAMPGDWIILNNKASGVYRVNYDPHTWTQLADTLHSPNFTVINELNRLQLVLDAMSLAKVGQLDYNLAIKVLKYVQKETAYNPWRAAITSIQDLELLLWRTEKFDEFKKLVQFLMTDIYKRFSDLTSTPTGYEDTRHKTMITKWACIYGVGDCSKKANQLFKAWMSSNVNPIPKDLRSMVYCDGIRQGGQIEWDYVWSQYKNSNIANEKSTFLHALAFTEDEVLLSRFLNRSLDSSSGVRKQDAASVFCLVAETSRQGYRLALDFLENNIQRIYDYLAPNTQDLGDYISVLTHRMVYDNEVDKMKKFVTTHKKLLEKAELTTTQALESAENNLEWMNSFYDKISEALAV